MSLQGTTGLGGGIAKSVLQGGETEIGPIAVSGYYPLYSTKKGAETAGNGAIDEVEVDGSKYLMPRNGVFRWNGDFSPSFDEVPLSIAGYYPVYKTRIKAWSEAIADGAEGKKILEETMVVWGDDNMAYYHPNVYASKSWQGTFATTKRAEDIRLTEQSLMSSDPGFGIDGVAVGRNDSGIIIAVGASAAQDRDGIVSAGAAIMNPDVNDDTYEGLDYALTPPANDMSGKVYIYDKDQNLLAELVCPDRDASDAMMADGHAVGFGYEVAIGEGIIAVTSSKFERTKISDISLFPLYTEKGSVRTWHPDIDESQQKPPMRQVDVTGYKAERQAQGAVHIFDANTFEHKYSLVDKYTEDNDASPGQRTSVTYGSALSIGHGRLAVGDRFCQTANSLENDGTGDNFTFESRGAIFVYDITKPTGLEVQNSELMIKRPSNEMAGIPNHSGNITSSSYAKYRASFGERGKMKIGAGSLIVGDPRYNDYRNDYDHSTYSESHYTHIEGDELPWSTGAVFAYNLAEGKLKWCTDGLDDEVEWLANNSDLTDSYSLDRTRVNRLGTGWAIDISGDKIFVATYRGGDNQTNVDGLIHSIDNNNDVNSHYNIGSCLVMSPDGDILSTVRRRRVTAESGTDMLSMARGTGNASSMAADGNTVYFGVPTGDATLDYDENTGFIEIYTVGTGDSYNDQGHKAATHVGTFHSSQRDPLYHTDLRYALNGIGDQKFGSRVLTHENTLLATSVRYYPFTEVYYYDIDDLTKEEDGPKAVSGYYPLYNTKKYASAASATNQCERVTVDSVVYYRPIHDGAAPTKWEGDFTAASETGPMAVNGHYPLYLTERAAYLESLVPERTPSMRFSVDVVSTNSGNKFRMRTDTEHTTYTALPKMYRNIFTLERGKTYVFDQQDASNVNHPLQWSLTEDGDSITDTEFVRSVGVAGGNGDNTSAGYTTITIPSDFAGDRLYYKCGNHAGMGSLGYAEIRDPGIASADQVTLNNVIYYIPKGVTYFDGNYDSETSETGPLEINGYYPLYLTHSAAKDGGDDPILVDVPAQDINYYMPSDVDIKRTYGTFGTKSAQEMFSDRIDITPATMGTVYSQLRGDSTANHGNAYITDKYIIFGDDQHVSGTPYYNTHPVTGESMGGGKVILFRKDGTFFANLSPNYLLKKKYPADADSILLSTGSTTWPNWGTSVAATDKWLVVGGPVQKGIPGQGRSTGAVVVFDISKTTLEEIEASMQVLVYDDNDDPITDHPDTGVVDGYGGQIIINQFGRTVSISNDGSTIAIGAPESWSDQVWKTVSDPDSPEVTSDDPSVSNSKAYHQRYNKYGRTFIYALNESTDVWEADGEVTVPYWANKWNSNRYPVWSNWDEQIWDVPSITSFARTGIAYRHWGHTVAVGKNHIAVACESYFASSTTEMNTSNMEKYPAVVAVFDRHTKKYLYTHGTKVQNAGKQSHFGETMKFLEIQGTEYLFVSSHTAGEDSLYGYWQTKEEGALYIYDYSKPNPGGEETILRMNHMVESGSQNEFGRVFGANDSHIFVQVTGYSSTSGVRKSTHTGEYVGYNYPKTTNSSNQYTSDVRNTFIIPVEDVLGHRGTINVQNYVLLGASGNLGTSYVYDIAVDNDTLVVSNQAGSQDSYSYQYDTDDGTVKNAAITIYNLKKTAAELRLNVEGYYPVWEFENLSNSESSDGQSNEYVLNGKKYYQPVSPSYSTWQGDYAVGLPPIAIDGHYPVYETILDAQSASIDGNHEIFVGSDGITYYKPVNTKFTTWEGDFDSATSETGPLEVSASYPLYLTYDAAVNASPTNSATTVTAGGVNYWFPDGVFGNSQGQHMFDLNELSVRATWQEHGIRPFNFDANGNIVERGNIVDSSSSMDGARFGHAHDANEKYIAISSPNDKYLPDMTLQTDVGQVRIFKHNSLGPDTFVGAVYPNNSGHVGQSFGNHCVHVSQDGLLYVMGTELRSDGINYDIVYEYDLNSENEATIQGSQHIYRQTGLIGLNATYGPQLVQYHGTNLATNSNHLFIGAPSFMAEHTTNSYQGAIVVFDRTTKTELTSIFAPALNSRFGSNLAVNDSALMVGSTLSTDQLYIYQISGDTFTYKGQTERNNTNATGMGWGYGPAWWHKFVDGYYYTFNAAPGTQYTNHGITGVNQGSQYSMARIYRWKEEDALNILTAQPDKWWQLRDIPGSSRSSWAGPTNIDITATFIVITSNGNSPEETYMWSPEEDISTAITIPTSDYFEYGLNDVTIIGRKFYVGAPIGVDQQYYEETGLTTLRVGEMVVYDGTVNPDRIPSAVGGHYPVFQFELSAQQASTDGVAVAFDHGGQRYFKPNVYPYTTWSGDYSITDAGAPHIVDGQYPLYKTIGAAMLGSVDESYEVVEMSDGVSYFRPTGVRAVAASATVQSVIDGDIGPAVINGNYPCFDSHLASNAESSAYNGGGVSTTFVHEGVLYFQPAGSSITIWSDGTYGNNPEDTSALVVNTDGTVGATTGSYPLYQSRLVAESVSWGVGQSTAFTYGGVTYFMPSGTFVTTFTGNDYSLDATYQLNGETYRYDEAVYSSDGQGNTYYPLYFAEADAIAGGDGTASSMTLPFANPATGLSQTTFFVANGVTLLTDYVPGVSDVEKLIVDAHYPLYLTAASAIKESPTNSYTAYTLSGTTYFMPNDVLYETFIGTLGKLNNRTDVMNTEQVFDFSGILNTSTSSSWWCKVAAGKNFIAVAAYNNSNVLIFDYDMNHLYTINPGGTWGNYQYGSEMKWAPETCDNPDVLYVGDHKYSDSSYGRYGRVYRYDCSLGSESAVQGSMSYVRDTYGSYYRDFGKAFEVSDNYLFVGSPGYYPSTLLYENPQHGSLLSSSLLKRRDTGSYNYYLGESVAISVDREDGKPDIFAASEPYNYRYGRVRFYGPDLSGENTSGGSRYELMKGNLFFKDDENGNRYLIAFSFDYYNDLYERYYGYITVHNAAAYNTVSKRTRISPSTTYYQQAPSYGTVKMFGQQSGIAATGKGDANGSLADGTYVSGCGQIYLWDWALTSTSPYLSFDIKYGDDNTVWAINPNSTADARSGAKFGFVGSWDMDHEMKYIWAATADHKLFRYSFNAVLAGSPQAVEGYYPVYSFEPDSNNVSPTKTSTMIELGGQYWFQPNNVTFKTWQGDFDPATAETGPLAIDGHYPLYVLQSSALDAGQANAETSVYLASDGIGYFVPGGITTWDGDYDPATSETGPLAIDGHYPLYLTSGGALAASQAFSNNPGVERVDINGVTYFMPANVSYETWSEGGYSDSTPLAVNGYYPVYKSELGAKTEALAAYALVGSDADATAQHYTLNNVTYYMPTGVPYTTWTGDYDASTSDATPLNVNGYYPLNLTYATAKASGFGGVGTVAIDGTLYYYATNGLKVWLGDYNPQTSDIEPMAVEGYYPLYYTATSAGANAQQIIFGDQVYYLKVDGNENRGSYGRYDYADVIANSVKISSSTLTDYDITTPQRLTMGEGYIAVSSTGQNSSRGMISVYNYDGEFQWSAFAPYGFANSNQQFGSALSIYKGKLFVGHSRYGSSNAQYGAVHVYNLSKTPVTVPSYASNREYMGVASSDYQNSGMLRQGDYVTLYGPGGMLSNRTHNSYFGANIATGHGLVAIKANYQANPDPAKTVAGIVSVYDAETLEWKFDIDNRQQVSNTYFAMDMAIGCGVIAITEVDIVQVYDLEGNFITTVYPYNNSNLRVAYDRFGQSIEIDGEYMIVGQSEAHETNISKGGVIHVFNINSIKNGTYDPNSTSDVMLWGPPHRVANSVFGYSGIHAYGRFWSGHAYAAGTDSAGTSIANVGGLYSYDVDVNRPSYGTIINSADAWQPSGTELDGISTSNIPRFGQYVAYKDGVLVVGGYSGYDSARASGGYYKIYRLAPETFSIADEATVSEIVEGADSANVSDMTLDTSPSISLFLSTHRHQLTDRPTSMEQYCPATTAINEVSTVLSPSTVNGTQLYKIQFSNHRPTVDGQSPIFSSTSYTGNGSTQTINSGVDNTAESLVWIKNRDGGDNHRLFDTIRGPGEILSTNGAWSSHTATSSELSAFTSTGFDLGSGSGVNYNTHNYISWTFSSAPNFFDIVTYSGQSNNGAFDTWITVPHNLGSTPGCVIIKSTSNAESWVVWHKSVPTETLHLNQNGSGNASNYTTWFGHANGAADANNIYVRAGQFASGFSGYSYVAYVFADSPSNQIKCGSYAGTGPGMTVDVGFKPHWVMLKSSSNNDTNWVIADSSRPNEVLWPNSGDAAYPHVVSFTDTGFTLDSNSSYMNLSGYDYIYIAIGAPMAGDYLDPEPDETIVRHFRAGERVQNIQGTASGTIYSVRASLADGGGSGSDYMNVYDTTGTFNVGDSVQLVGTKPKDNELARNWVKVATQQIEKFYFIKHIGNGVILAGSGDMDSSGVSYANLNSRRLFRSDDYGTTWSVMDPAAELGHPVADDMYKTAYIPFMYTACEDLGGGKALIAVGNDSMRYDYTDMIPYMLRTEDYGLTWSIVEPIAPMNTPPDTIEYGGVYVEWMKQIKAIRHLGNGVVLAGVGEHSIQGPRATYQQTYRAGLLVRSTDYGQTWTPIQYENADFASNSIGIRAFSTNKINNEWWMASYDGSWVAGNDFALVLHKSSDEGLTWTNASASGLHSDQVSNSHAPFIDSMIQLDNGTILISQGGSPGTSTGRIYRYSDSTTFPLSGSVQKSIPNSNYIDTMELTELSDLPGYVIATAKTGMPGYAVVALSRDYGENWEVMNDVASTGVGDHTKYALGKDAFRSFVSEYVGNGRIIAGSGGNATKVTYSSATLTENVGKRFEPMNYGHLWVSDMDSNYLEKIGRTILIDLGEDNLVGNGDSIHIDFDQYISKLDGMEGKMKFYDANGLEIVTGDHSDPTTEIKIKDSTGVSNIGDHLVSVRSGDTVSGYHDYFGTTRPNTITGLNRLSNMLDGSFKTYFEFVLSQEAGCPYPSGWSRTAAQVAGSEPTTWNSSSYEDITWYDFSPGSMPWMGNENDTTNINSYYFWIWYQVSRQTNFKYMMVFEDKDGNEKWLQGSMSKSYTTINVIDDIGWSLNSNGLFGHRLKSIAFFNGDDDKTVMKIFGFGGTVEGVDFTYNDDDYLFGPYKDSDSVNHYAVGAQSTISDQNSSYGPSLFTQKRLRLEIESTTRKARYLRIPVIDAQAIRDIGIE